MKIRLLRAAIVALATLVLGYLALCLGVYLMQGKLIFPAPTGAQTPRTVGGQLLRIPQDGGEVVALHYPAPIGAPTVVHFHGNGEQLADDTHWLERLHDLGLGVLAVEYPGYGMSPGKPSEKGNYSAAETALGYLREKLGVPVEQTVLEGQSLGSGAATEMARRGLGARLVLLSPFTSIVDMAGRAFPFLPAGLLVRHRFDNASKIGWIRMPTLIVHGTADEVVPVEMGKRLAELSPNAELHLIEGAPHDLQSAGSEKLARCVAAFARGERCQLP